MLSSHLATSKMLHYRQQFSIKFSASLGAFSKNMGAFSKKRWTFSKKRWTFSQKRGSFFSVPSDEKISHSKQKHKKKQENKGPTSLEVQLLMARIDNFQAQTHQLLYKAREETLLRCGARLESCLFQPLKVELPSFVGPLFPAFFVFLFAVRNLFSEGTEKKLPRFWENVQRFFGKVQRFLRKLPCFLRKRRGKRKIDGELLPIVEHFRGRKVR